MLLELETLEKKVERKEFQEEYNFRQENPDNYKLRLSDFTIGINKKNKDTKRFSDRINLGLASYMDRNNVDSVNAIPRAVFLGVYHVISALGFCVGAAYLLSPEARADPNIYSPIYSSAMGTAAFSSVLSSFQYVKERIPANNKVIKHK